MWIVPKTNFLLDFTWHFPEGWLGGTHIVVSTEDYHYIVLVPSSHWNSLVGLNYQTPWSWQYIVFPSSRFMQFYFQPHSKPAESHWIVLSLSDQTSIQLAGGDVPVDLKQHDLPFSPPTRSSPVELYHPSLYNPTSYAQISNHYACMSPHV